MKKSDKKKIVESVGLVFEAKENLKAALLMVKDIKADDDENFQNAFDILKDIQPILDVVLIGLAASQI